MFRNKRIRRFIAVFLLINMVHYMLWPTLSYALTSGPTAPEATSFEPVDTTDMVNLLTGDLTYNIPLLEVPGPAGGHPISLSYHAGIQPDEDASWTGLGWTLNPGAITRMVNAYPDDHKDITGTDRTFWEGGETTTYTAGISVAVPGMVNVTAGLSYSQDTYRGFSSNALGDVRLNTSIFNVSQDNQLTGISYTPSLPLIGAAANLAIGGPTIGYDRNSGLDVSMDGVSLASKQSGGKSRSIAAGISKNVFNSKQGNVSTKGSSSGINLAFGTDNFGIGIRLGRSYQRYWTDETERVATNGSLHFPNSLLTYTQLNNKSFDTYDLLEINTGAFFEPDAAKNLGGTFPDYDLYNVNAQGLGGSIKPHHFYEYLYRQNRNDDTDPIVQCYPLGATGNAAHYRFRNDFSNKFLLSGLSQDPFNFSINPASQIETGENGNDGYLDNDLAGSRRVRYFTNNQLTGFTTPLQEGFIDCVAPGFDRHLLEADRGEQVGGFMITNESGVTYHFALPAYSFDEYTYSGKKDIAGKDIFNQYKRPTGYAYTWYLTAITGPDFVDFNSNGLADENDFGYWVTFEYGKWADNYQWRNPAIGFNKDIDQDFENFSKGKKELYYLNAIKTATHTAIFVKEIRNDGKSGTSRYDEAALTNDVTKEVTYVDHGSFFPERRTIPGATCPPGQTCRNLFTRYMVNSLGLKEVYLLKNANVPAGLAANSANYDHKFQYDYVDAVGNSQQYVDRYHYGQNVIDIHDIADMRETLVANSLRGISLETDYSLCPFTENSSERIFPDQRSRQISGKFTLRSLKFLGKGGADLIPPTRFNYELPDNLNSIRFYAAEEQVEDIDGSLEAGDILTFQKEGIDHYVVLLEDQGGGLYTYRIIRPEYSDSASPLEGDFLAAKTKNPPYDKELHDIWGFYKPDYDKASNSENENFGRRVTDVSAKSVDVWCLRQVKTSLGAGINLEYEPDYYEEVALGGRQAYRIKDVVHTGGNSLDITLWDEGVDLSKIEGVSGLEVIIFASYDISAHPLHDCPASESCRIPDTETKAIDGIFDVSSTNSGTLTLSGSDFTIVNNLTKDQISVPLRSETSSCGDTPCQISISAQWPDYISAGLVYLPRGPLYGGGIRVRQIRVDDGLSSRRTDYTYEQGITSYEPLGVLKPQIDPAYLDFIRFNDQAREEFFTNYKVNTMKDQSLLLNVAREMPGPGVIYGKVSVNETVNQDGQGEIPIPVRQVYEFETYYIDDAGVKVKRDPGAFVSTPLDPAGDEQGIIYDEIQRDKITINDYSSRIGRLKTTTLFNGSQEVTKTENQYLPLEPGMSDFQDFAYQGIVNEVFADARFVKPRARLNHHLLGIVSQRNTYPSIQTKQIVTNFKTGITSETHYKGFDFYSGQTTLIQTKDSRGQEFLEEVIPAYRKYSNGMDLSLNGGKNMLTQTASTRIWKLNPPGDTEPYAGLVSVEVQTWSDQVPVLEVGSQSGLWRKQSNYQWNGSLALQTDGTYPTADFLANAFNWTTPGANSQWEKVGEVTLYDGFSHGLEAQDINGQHAATRMGPEQYRVIASVAPSSYNEMAFSGAEFYSDFAGPEGGVDRGQGVPSEIRSHTGKYSLVVSPGAQGFNYTLAATELNPAGKYLASVWVYLPGAAETSPEINNAQLYYDINGVQTSVHPAPQKNKSKSWYLLNLVVEPNGSNNILIGCRNQTSRGIYFDDFRVHPLGAAMNTYVYDQTTDEMTYILDADNLYTHFSYDGMGRLVKTTREHLNFPGGSFKADQVVNEVIYNYGN